MTIEEIRASDKTVLTPGDVAEVLNCDPQDVRLAAKEHPERLGFPVCVIGTRTKIPKVPFLKFIGVDDYGIRGTEWYGGVRPGKVRILRHKKAARCCTTERRLKGE